MQVRLDKRVTQFVRAGAKKSGLSMARETNTVLSHYYLTGFERMAKMLPARSNKTK